MIPRADRATAAVAVLGVTAALLATILAFALLSESTFQSPRYLLYPVVWIGVAVWIGLRVRPRRTSPGTATLATAVGVGYFLVLLWFTGYLATGSDLATGLSIRVLSPGWGPLIVYDAGFLRLTVVPFQFLGYLALAYLVAATVVETAKSLAAGALGIASCVGCTWPLVAGLAGGTGAGWLGAVGASGATDVALTYTHELSTLLFLGSVGLLLWVLDRKTG